MTSAILSGRVVDKNDRPVAGAAVYFVSAPIPLPDIAQLTGSDGRFSLSAPKPGVYRLGVNAPDHRRHEEDIEVGRRVSPLTIRLIRG